MAPSDQRATGVAALIPQPAWKGFKKDSRASLKPFTRPRGNNERMTTSSLKSIRRLAPRAQLGVLLAVWLATSLSGVAADPAVEPAPASPALKLAADTLDPVPPPPPSAMRGKTREKNPHEQKMESMGVTIALVSVVMGIGIAFFAIGCDFLKRRHLINVCHQERLAALEKGLELPPYPREFMSGADAGEPSGPSTGLKSGLVWLAIGIGIAWFLSSGRRGGLHPSIGAIPIGIGAAYLIYYVIEGRKLMGTRPPGRDE